MNENLVLQINSWPPDDVSADFFLNRGSRIQMLLLDDDVPFVMAVDYLV